MNKGDPGEHCEWRSANCICLPLKGSHVHCSGKFVGFGNDVGPIYARIGVDGSLYSQLGVALTALA